MYHFALVNDLAWFSAGVHLTTLTVLEDYFLARPILRNWRVALMLTMAQLLIASTVMQGHYEWYDSWPYEAQCLFDDFNGNIGGQPRYWMFVGLTLICLNYTLSIIPLFEWPTRHLYLLFYTKPRAAKDQAIEKLKEKLSNHISPTSFKGSMKRFGYILLILFLSTIGGMYFALLALVGSNTGYLVLDIF